MNGSTFSVVSTGDSGAGTLRQAILNANTSPGLDVIDFNLPGGGPYVIQPVVPLPTILDPVVIDGTTQPGFSGTPVIRIDGSNTASAAGLGVVAGGSSVRGLAVTGFFVGLYLTIGGGNTIQGDYIGLDTDGSTALANSNGVVAFRSSANTIGGTNAGDGNVISANTVDGIELVGGKGGAVIEGNLVGTDSSGGSAVGNGRYGIVVAAPKTTVGGTTQAARNVISANGDDGVHIVKGADSTLIEGNFVGTNATGDAGLGNGHDGIGKGDPSKGTIRGNVVAGNGVHGGAQIGIGAGPTIVAGNYVGTNAVGTAAISPPIGGFPGIVVAASSCVIGGTGPGDGNVISGNSSIGLQLHGSNLVVEGNLIGTDATGTIAIPNGDGVTVHGGNTRIGGPTVAERNVISGNSGNGIVLDPIRPGPPKVIGNYIGTTITGDGALGNGANGIWFQGGGGTVVGGSAEGAGNVISANGGDGILLGAASTAVLQGNLIGTNAGGTFALPNGADGIQVGGSGTFNLGNRIGGTTPGSANVISGNLGSGVHVASWRVFKLVVQGNLIGTDASGAVPLGNGVDGVFIDNPSASDPPLFGETIGGPKPGAGNLIAGNVANGVEIHRASKNVIQGNFIGTNAAGLALPNGADGIALSIADENVINRNLVAANGARGVSLLTGAGNAILDNSIYGNTLLGVDLGADGVTLNDAGDSDAGPNDLQNYPLLSNLIRNGNKLTLTASLNSVASEAYRIQLFNNPTCDLSSNGEGQTPLGSASLKTTASGDRTLTVSLAYPANASSPVVTATATDSAGNTSEFSPCLS